VMISALIFHPVCAHHNGGLMGEVRLD
jgi:hypothetical protein